MTGRVDTARSRRGDVVVTARDASYVRADYRSFEFVGFEARAGEVTALLGADDHAGRDLLLAIAGMVRPTAGSLAVMGVELAVPAPVGSTLAPFTRVRRALSSRTSARLPRGAVGVGVVSGLLDVDMAAAVEDVIARQVSLMARGGHASGDVLDFLGSVGLATVADASVESLAAPHRARLSAALALAGGPAVAVIDLADPFCAGLSAADGAKLVRDLRVVSRATGAAVIVFTADAAIAQAADASFPLDADAGDIGAQVGSLAATAAAASAPRAAGASPASSDSKGVEA